MRPGKLISPSMLETLITRPHFCRLIGSPAARQQSQGPFRFVSITWSQSASLSFSIGPRILMPALFTRISSRPKVSSVCATMRVHVRLRVTSAAMPRASLPGTVVAIVRNLRRRGSIARSENHGGPRRRQCLGEDPPKAARPARHERHPAIEPEPFEDIHDRPLEAI